jgi:hypothetical protein
MHTVPLSCRMSSKMRALGLVHWALVLIPSFVPGCTAEDAYGAQVCATAPCLRHTFH